MVEQLLSQNESKTLEFKESAQSVLSIVKTIIAFANTAGGNIIIGVEDKTKKIVGVKNVLQEEERLANIIADSIQPHLFPDIEIFCYANCELLIINVPYLVGPYYYKKSDIQQGTFIRLGSTNRLADSETLASLLRASKHISFDETPCVEASLVSLDELLIEKTLSPIHKNLQKNNYESLGLIKVYNKKTYPSYAALLLFSPDRIKFMPDSMIRCVCYAGQTTERIIDQKEMTNGLIVTLDELIAFIERHTNMGAHIAQIKREDIPQFPTVAVRESIVNALVHADYSMSGTSIQIAVYADRIEITNPGGLPFGQSLESALSGISKMRNKIIGRIFRELKIIERLGSGLGRIISTYARTNALPPKFEEINNHFRVTLFAVPQVDAPLTVWEEKLIKKLKTHPGLTTQDIAKLWEVTERTARLRLKKMLSRRLLKRIATSQTDPTAQYRL